MFEFDFDVYKMYNDLYDNCRYYMLILKNKLVEVYYRDSMDQLRSTFLMIGGESEAQEIDIAIDESVEITYDEQPPSATTATV